MEMNPGFRSQCVPTYRVLSEEQVLKIHLATLELLDTVGVQVMHPEAVAMLHGAGCRVTKDNIVQIPNGLVETSIRSAPSSIFIYNRLGQEAMHLEGRNTYFGMGTDLIKTWDLDSGKLRKSCLRDVKNSVKIGDYLPEIDFVASFALPLDSPPNLMNIDAFKAELEHSVKPIYFVAAGLEDLEIINDMAAEAVGGHKRLREKPIHIHYSEPLSPLTHTYSAVSKLFFCADHGIPVNYSPGMMSGATAPVTLAGAITMGNAEALSGIVLHQLRGKGSPIISGFGMSTFDMQTSTCVYGCPEYRLAISACADLYHYYGIPMWGTGGVSDAHYPDQQAGMEWAISLFNAGLDGANLVHDVGYLGQGLIGHPAALVMCAEIISYVRRAVCGFDIDPEHIGMDVIQQVGPRGEFISTDQTMTFFQQEHWRPQLCNRDNLQSWSAKGSKSWGELSTEKAAEILKTHQPQPLPKTVHNALERIRSEAVVRLKHKDFKA
jgi:trimethylamine--corrinoid protein Co-methyltransferase